MASSCRTALSTSPPRRRCAPAGRQPALSTAMSMSTPSPETSLAIAVDIGGTFTDIALHDAKSGRIWRAKTPSVPADPSHAFLTGMRLALAEAGHAAPSLDSVLHGTTVATNMILAGQAAKPPRGTTPALAHACTT